MDERFGEYPPQIIFAHSVNAANNPTANSGVLAYFQGGTMVIGICDDLETTHEQIKEYVTKHFEKDISFVDFMDGKELVKYFE